MGNLQQMRERWGLTEPLAPADEQRQPADTISTFHFAEVIGQLMKVDTVLATGCSGLATEIFQLSIPLPPHKDLICSWSLGSMGFGIPTAIGACIGSGRKNTICIEGDAGIQLSIAELSAIESLVLPVKLFVLNNSGMSSMRVSQQRWFGRKFGADEDSDLHLPALEKVAAAYDIPYVRLDGWGDLREQVKSVLETSGPVLCEVPSPPDEQRPPQQQRTTSGWVPVMRLRDE